MGLGEIIYSLSDPCSSRCDRGRMDIIFPNCYSSSGKKGGGKNIIYSLLELAPVAYDRGKKIYFPQLLLFF